MVYHPPGHEFHKMAWFPREKLGGIVCGDCLKAFEAAWLKSQDAFWDQVEKLDRFEGTSSETGERLSDDSDPNSIGIPNYAGLPTHVVKLNDLKRLREAGDRDVPQV